MSLASDFEDLWNEGSRRITDYDDLAAMVISIDGGDFDVRVKDRALMITFSDGSCVKLQVDKTTIN